MHLILGLTVMILSLIILVRRLGILEKKFDVNVLFMFTNLSVFVCWAFYSVELLFIEESQLFSCMKFYLMIYMVLVMVVYNLILVPNAHKNRLDYDCYSLHNCIAHLLIPILVAVDYYSYTTHYIYPVSTVFKSLAYPAVYGFLVFIKGVFKFGKEYEHSRNYYPYFFLDLEKLGFGKVAINCIILLSSVIIFAMILLIINNTFWIPKKELLTLFNVI